MTLLYNLFFVSVWSTAVLAIPTILGLFALLVYTFTDLEDDHTDTIVLLVFFILFLVAWTVGLRNHQYRVLIRSGAFPAWCRDDRTPHDELELRQAIVELRERKGRNPAIVGGGWGYWLKRYGPPAPRIFTHEFTGRLRNEPGRWRAGTTIATVVKHYEKQGLTLECHPTMDFISLGSWVSHANHGNAGDANSGAHESIDTITLLDMDLNTTQRTDYKTARRLFDFETTNKYVVLDLSFRMVKNDLLQKRGILVHDAQSVADWLAPGAALRLLFLGAARDYAIGIRWEKPYKDNAHNDPHCCSRLCTFLQTDVLSVCGGCHENMSKFQGKTTRLEANKWLPPIFPVSTISVVLLGIRNFEVFFKLSEPLNGNTLGKFVKDCIAWHKARGGRSEIRYARPSADTVVHWDVSCQERDYPATFRLLADSLGVTECAIHPGKADVADTSPLTRVSCYEMYYGKSV